MDAAGERRGRRQPGRRVRPARRTASGSRSRAIPTRRSRSACAGAELVGWTYEGPFDDLAGAAGRRAPRHPVGRGLARRGHRHRPHRAGLRRRGLRALARARPAGAHAGRRGGPVLRRLRLAARPVDDRGRRSRSSATSRARPPRRGRPRSPPLPDLLALPHAAHLPHRRRLVHLRRRAPAADARRERDRRVDAAQYMGKRMDDWLHNMGDWNISRRRYYGLPLPFYPCACGHLNVIGSRAELEERAVSGLDQLEELRRPWIDRVPHPLRECGEPRRAHQGGRRRLARRRHRPVLDARLAEPRVDPARLRDRRRRRALTAPTCPTTRTGRSGSRPTGSRRCASRSGCGSTRSSSCRSCSTGRAPFRRVLGYEKMLDETGREMHDSWGNTIELDDAFDRMGADVMRWQYCAQPPSQHLRFGFGPAEEVKRQLPHLLELGQVLRRLREHRGFRPVVAELEPPTATCSRSTAGSSSGRTRSSPTRRPAYERVRRRST